MGRLGTVKDAARRAGWWAASPAGLAWLFFVGLVIRLVLARGGGFPFDMTSFAAWSNDLAERGPGNFYPDFTDPEASESYFVDYPPGYLYVLYAIGKLVDITGAGAPSVFLLKLPGVLADLGAAWFAVLLATRLTPVSIRKRVPVAALAAGAILFNPAIFFVSSVWGQVDSILALLVLGAFVLLGTGSTSFAREAAGLSVLAVAVGTKPQAAFVVPVVVLLLAWRHIRAAVAESRSLTSGALLGLGRVVAPALVAVGVGFLLLAPFGLDPVQAFAFYRKASQTYTVTSVFAFNLWGAVDFWRPDSGAPDAVRVFGIPALHIGLAAFAAAAAVVLWWAWRALRRGELEGRILVFGGVAMVLVAFSLLTRIHERYLFLALALLAPLVAYRALRRAYVGLSVLYLANVYFPYVYYLEYEGRPSPRVFFFDALYGVSLDSPQMKALSVLTALAALGVAWRGWRWLTARHEPEEPGPPPPEPAGAPEPADEPEEEPRRSWTLTLHPLGRRGTVVVLVVFLVALATRLIGLGSPRGMYFDEVYHARTAGEYLEGKEVYEWTHPPLAKELMALSITALGSFDAELVDADLTLPPIAATADRLVWTERGGSGGRMVAAPLLDGCGVGEASEGVRVGPRASAMTASGETIYVGGSGPEGPSVARVEGSRERWRVPVPASPTALAALGDVVFVVTSDGSLVRISADGDTDPLATGAVDVAAAVEGDTAWVSFPDRSAIVSYGPDGAERASIDLPQEPASIVVPSLGERVVVATADGDALIAVDTTSSTPTGTLDVGADHLAGMAGSGLVWAFDGERVRVVEPRGVSVIGATDLPFAASAVAANEVGGTVLVVSDDGRVACVDGRPAFAWRFGSAVFGALMAALAAAIALRLFGSPLVGALAGLFVIVDGLAFTLSRIAMNDSYVTAFILAAWFAVLSGLRRWGWTTTPEDPSAGRSRTATIAWFAAAGLAVGLAGASKWVAAYALAGIGLLLLWDAVRRGRQSVLSVAGGPVRSVLLIGLLFVGVPLGVYVASYIPYFGLGHDVADLIQLQQGMYGYHANLDADHPFGSAWYSWPSGHKPVYLYLSERGGHSEIWSVPNPVVFFGGILGLGALALRSWRRRAIAPAVVVLAALVQYLPWTTVSRVTFLYHYLPVVPFLAIGLAWWVGKGSVGTGLRRGVEVAVVAGAAVGAFLLLLPILDGWTVGTGYLEGIKTTLFWMF